VQTGVFDAAPGPVHAGSAAAAKVAFFAALFAARPDVYALRWENARSGRSGWTPAVRGGWRKGVPAAEREYLPLTEEVITAHLSGDLELGLYPMLDGDRCRWLAADFDGATALLDALAYLKAVRAAGELACTGPGAASNTPVCTGPGGRASLGVSSSRRSSRALSARNRATSSRSAESSSFRSTNGSVPCTWFEVPGTSLMMSRKRPIAITAQNRLPREP